ncbi:hypothetical protein [Sphaerisporangium siamense]|uniref:Uncharacterized protein n=1 Tax=Sphaerisporangium siamense TaxID=795645 RepID=A0A7W7DBG8_9ACTN|nr:hypothetical protein [Sphaerisporangium siamense]MBB4702318.1 hypothetical protein [Sphaerisporangium siamense]
MAYTELRVVFFQLPTLKLGCATDKLSLFEQMLTGGLTALPVIW